VTIWVAKGPVPPGWTTWDPPAPETAPPRTDPTSAVLTNARLVTSRKFLSRTTGFSHSSLRSAHYCNARLVTSRKFLSRTTGFSHSSLLDTSPWVENEGRLSKHRKSLTTPLPRALRPLFLTSSDRGRQYEHDRRDTRERNAHGSGVVKLFLCFDRRPSFLIQGDESSRLLCENPVVRDKNFRLVTSLALVSTAQSSDRWEVVFDILDHVFFFFLIPFFGA